MFATIIGAGFATGQEILQFFAKYGRFSYVGLLVSSVLFGVVIYAILEKTRVDRLELNKTINWISYAFCFLAYIIMVAGFANVLYEHLGLHKIYSWLLVNVFSVLVSKKQKGIEIASLILAPIIILLILVICAFIPSSPNEVSTNVFNIVIKGIIYASYNIITLAMLTEGLDIKTSKKQNLIISCATALLIIVLSFGIWRALAGNISASMSVQIPMLKLSGGFSNIYVLAIAAAILTTAFSNFMR
ncbi:hypothetical protein [Treponema sp. R6D11]